MKATEQLPPTYREGAVFNLATWRTVLGMNTAGLIALFVFGWLFVQLAFRVRPEFSSPNLRLTFAGLDILGFFLTLVVTMILHELVHGFFFWLYTRARPKFGFNILYAYAAAPGWYFPRNQFMWVGLAPLVVLTIAGVLLLPFVPLVWVPRLLLALIVNAAGAVGDLWVVIWLAGRQRDSYIQDRGPMMQIYLPQLPVLRELWQVHMTSFGVPMDSAAAAFSRLATEYETGARYYHTLLHVQNVLAAIDNLAGFATDPVVVALAGWYHDAVYDPQRMDNEAQSAQFARQELTTLGIPAKVVAEVQRLILLTAGYNLPTWEQAGREDRNAHVLLDADLAGLSDTWAEFKQNGENIRREFAEVPAEIYKQERQAILRRFLDRERIYFTPPMFARGEEKARQNIKQELSDLQKT